MHLLRAAAPLRSSLFSSPTCLTSTSALLITRPLSTSTRAAALPSRSLLFRRTARPLTVALGLALPFIATSRPTLNDSSPGLVSPSGDASFSSSASVGGKKDVPVFKNGNLNPAAVKQISLGGMLGLGAGVLLSMLSRVLVLAVGVGIVVWQYAARKGYNIIPVERVQRYVKGINVQSAIQDNVAFKVSFGLVFALTAFGEF